MCAAIWMKRSFDAMLLPYYQKATTEYSSRGYLHVRWLLDNWEGKQREKISAAQVLARGERIENLVDKTDNLRTQADRFHR